MLFNSTQFLVFYPVVFVLYWAARGNTRLQNWLLLLASYFFYCWWDWRFLWLILLATGIHFFCAQRVRGPRGKAYLAFSLVASLLMLATFKYFNFFVDTFDAAFAALGVTVSLPTLKLILPIGISYYTFQTMGYSIDVYRGKAKATDDLLLFALFAAYFPRLVAGPIERSTTLLPELDKRRSLDFERVRSGLWLLFFGLFKKVAIADAIAPIANRVFDSPDGAPGVSALIAVYAFTIQIYCDFSGYSDMARGLSRLLGIELMVNFRRPYFAVDPRAFWQRWHISLSTWLRDYLYISLGGNRRGKWNTYRNLMITMVLGGLWHGSTWMFVAWGAFHGLILVIYRAIDQEWRWVDFAALEGLKRCAAMILMFHLACLGWIFFRADSLNTVWTMLAAIATDFAAGPGTWRLAARLLSLSALLFVLDTYQERVDKKDGENASVGALHPLLRGFVYFLIGLQLAIMGTQGGQAFIYFGF